MRSQVKRLILAMLPKWIALLVLLGVLIYALK